MIDRRTVLAAAGVLGAPAIATASQQRAPKGFLWGTAISAHQSEGNNTNSDTWLLENLKPSVFKDRSGDAIDSYHRFVEDIALNAALGFNAYRFGIEWARIEPSPGHFSNAELDHYAQVLEACHRYGQTPIVTYNHFSAPLWFAERGGWEAADASDLFARYCDHTTRRLGDLMGMATTFNEANVQLLLRIIGKLLRPSDKARAMIEAARRSTGSPRFSSLEYADADVCQPILLDAHAKGYQAIKAARAALPVGITLTTQEVEGVDGFSTAAGEALLYGGWVKAARESADFIGIQTYSRLLIGPKGLEAWPKGSPMTDAGYEYRPEALGATIRWAHRIFNKPLYVTENGIATEDDTQRILFIEAALKGVGECIDEGIEVRSYLYWSLLDNFEWASGYDKHFGLVDVDLKSFKRTPKPSAYWLGRRAKTNLI